jgi:NADH-quinone oxidoreductase subunit G
MRRLAGDDAGVNEEWSCDKGRWGFQYANAFDRITVPLVRDEQTGELREASWPEALSVAAEGLARARDNGGVGVLTGGRLTVEDAYAYSKFARIALGTNDIDFRARPLSAEETGFLASSVVGRVEVTYAEVETAPAVVIVGLEPEEECPILFLRLRKAWQKNKLRAIAVAPFSTRGYSKIGAVMVPTVPGAEASVLAESGLIRAALSEPGAILFVGERLASVPGGLSAAADLAAETGAKLAWVPRRAGDRGALEAGCLPNLLPGGLPVSEAGARAELAHAWQLEAGVLPHAPGKDTDAIVAAAHRGALGGLVVAGVDPADLSQPWVAEEALDRVGFLVSIELRRSAVSNRADVVFPVAPAVEKAGAYIDWEGRVRPFDAVLNTTAMGDGRVLDALAAEMGVELGCGDVLSVRRQLAVLADVRVERPAPPSVEPAQVSAPAAEPVVSGRRRAILATWHQLIDLGSLSDGDEYLAGTARPVVVAMSKGTATGLALADGTGPAGIASGDLVTVRSEQGAMTLPAQIVDDMVDGVVWVPTNSAGSTVRRTLGVTAGAEVEISSGGAE